MWGERNDPPQPAPGGVIYFESVVPRFARNTIIESSSTSNDASAAQFALIVVRSILER